MTYKVTIIHLNKKVTRLDGTEIITNAFLHNEKSAGIPLTIRHALRGALTATFNDEVVTGDVKFLRYNIAAKIYNADKPFELNDEEITQIKTCVGIAWSPEIVGFIYNLLEEIKSK